MKRSTKGIISSSIVCYLSIAFLNAQLAFASNKVTIAEQNIPTVDKQLQDSSKLLAQWDWGQFGGQVFDSGVSVLKRIPEFAPGAYVLDRLKQACDYTQCTVPIHTQDEFNPWLDPYMGGNNAPTGDSAKGYTHW